MLTGDLVNDCEVYIPIDPAVLRRLDADDLAVLVRVGRLFVARLSVEIDAIERELASRHRDPLIQMHHAAALDVADVMRLTGMSKQWICRASRPGRPLASCCRRQGRRRVWDADKLARWCDRQRA